MRPIRLAVLLAAALLLAACSMLGGEEKAGPTADQQLNDQGYAAMQAGDNAAAERNFLQALGANPSNPYATLNLGVIYQNTGRPDKARSLYERLLGTDNATLTKATGGNAEEAASLKKLAETNLALLPPPGNAAATSEPARKPMASEKVTAPETPPKAEEMPSTTAAPEPPSEPMPRAATPAGDYVALLASYTTAAGAEKGWARLVAAHPALLEPLDHVVVETDLGAKGTFFRLFASGMSSMEEVNKVCDEVAGGDDFCRRHNK